MAEFLGAGSTLQYKVGAGAAVDIDGIFSISSDKTFGTVPAMTLADTVKRYKATILDPGTLSVQAYYNGAAHDTLSALAGDETLTWILKVKIGASTFKTFTTGGILTNVNIEGIENESLVVFSFEVQKSGVTTVS